MSEGGEQGPGDLSGIPWFQDLDEAERELLRGSGEVVAFRAGECLFSEGEPADHFYLLLGGSVAVTKRLDASGERSKTLGLRGPGDSVGEMGAFAGMPRAASVRALADGRALRIPAELYRRMLEENPRGAAVLVKAMLCAVSHRLRHSDLELVTLFEVTRVLLSGAEVGDLLWETLQSLLFFCSVDAGLAFLVNPFSGALEAVQGAGREDFLARFRRGPEGDLQRYPIAPRLRALLAEEGARSLEGERAERFMEDVFGCPVPGCVGVVVAPLRDGAEPLGMLLLADLEGELSWPVGVLPLMDAVSAVVAPAVVLSRVRAAEKARERFEQTLA